MEFTGLTELVAKMRKARVEMAGPEMKKALRVGGRVIEDAIVQRAPMLLEEQSAGSDSLEPGALKDGMRVAVIDGENGPEAIIGPNSKVAHVARWVEYGHRDVHGGYLKLLGNGKTRGTGTANEVDIPAYPFIRPAFEASAADAGRAIGESLQKSFHEVMQ
jgi:HK97 gp10 family phage protein